MDARYARLEEELVAWGVLERVRGLALTRRFRAALGRAAADLQAEDDRARSGADAMRRAAARALERFELPPGAKARPEHASFVAAVELATLPDALRRAYGVD